MRLLGVGNYDPSGRQAAADKLFPPMKHAEVAELANALDSKSGGATPRAGSIPAGITSPISLLPSRDSWTETVAAREVRQHGQTRRSLTGGGDCRRPERRDQGGHATLIDRGYDVVGVRDGWQARGRPLSGPRGS